MKKLSFKNQTSFCFLAAMWKLVAAEEQVQLTEHEKFDSSKSALSISVAGPKCLRRAVQRVNSVQTHSANSAVFAVCRVSCVPAILKLDQ